MNKVKVHYDKNKVIELNIACQPETPRAFRAQAELIYRTLQREMCDFLSIHYPDTRSMMVGDIIEWVGTDVFMFCDACGFVAIDDITKDFILGLDRYTAPMTFSRIQNLIAQN